MAETLPRDEEREAVPELQARGEPVPGPAATLTVKTLVKRKDLLPEASVVGRAWTRTEVPR